MAISSWYRTMVDLVCNYRHGDDYITQIYWNKQEIKMRLVLNAFGLLTLVFAVTCTSKNSDGGTASPTPGKPIAKPVASECTNGKITAPLGVTPATVQQLATKAVLCVLGGGDVQCWGNDSTGQISKMPKLVNPTQISVGGGHTCAIDQSGLRCWGSDSFGQISKMPSLKNPTQVLASGLFTCARDASGIQCWGEDTYGIGAGLPNDQDLSQVVVGSTFACALQGNNMHCWGSRNFSGNFPGTIPEDTALQNPKQLAAGSKHICALDDLGVRCFGSDDLGPISLAPKLRNPVQISAGDGFSCAIDAGGVHCWGGNGFDGLTDGIPTLINPTQISAGDDYACALDQNDLHCWGIFTCDGFAHARSSQSPISTSLPPPPPLGHTLKDVRTADCSNAAGDWYKLDLNKMTASAYLHTLGSLDNGDINGNPMNISYADSAVIDFGLGGQSYSVLNGQMSSTNGSVDALAGLAAPAGQVLTANSPATLYFNFNEWQGTSVGAQVNCKFGF